MPEVKLDVMIVTHGSLDRAASMALPQVDGVRYTVSCQSEPCALPAALAREDVVVSFTPSRGVSANRNNALSLASAPYCLCGDDDLIYDPAALARIIEIFDADADLDFAAFRFSGPGAKPYPDAETPLTAKLPRGYWATAFEMAFRRKSVAGRIWFDETVLTAEDQLFLLDCRRAGLNCRFFPVTIAEHPGLTTGSRPIVDPGVARSEGYYIRRAYGLAGLLRIPLFAFRKMSEGRLRPGLIPPLIKGFFTKRKCRKP